MKFIPKSLSRMVGEVVLSSKKNSPTILFGAGVVGILGTVVLSSKATLKVGDILDEVNENLENINKAATEHPEKYSDADAQKDKIVVYTQAAINLTKLYAPAVLLGAASIACLTKSHSILNKRNAGLTAAYAALDRTFTEYRDRVRGEIGEEKEKELYRPTETKKVLDENDNFVDVQGATDVGGSPYRVCFDESNVNWQSGAEYNQIFLQCKQSYANDLLQVRGHVFLNEIYTMLGFPQTPAGAVVGWKLGNGDDFIDFGFFAKDVNAGLRFANGYERSVWLDFNVDGIMYDLI